MHYYSNLKYVRKNFAFQFHHRRQNQVNYLRLSIFEFFTKTRCPESVNELKVTVLTQSGEDVFAISSSTIVFKELATLQTLGRWISLKLDKWYKIQVCRIRLCMTILPKDDGSPVPGPSSPLSTKSVLAPTQPKPVKKKSSSFDANSTVVITTEQGDKYVGKSLNGKRHGRVLIN